MAVPYIRPPPSRPIHLHFIKVMLLVRSTDHEALKCIIFFTLIFLTAVSSKSSLQHPVMEAALFVLFPYYGMSGLDLPKIRKTNVHFT